LAKEPERIELPVYEKQAETVQVAVAVQPVEIETKKAMIMTDLVQAVSTKAT